MIVYIIIVITVTALFVLAQLLLEIARINSAGNVSQRYWEYIKETVIKEEKVYIIGIIVLVVSFVLVSTTMFSSIISIIIGVSIIIYVVLNTIYRLQAKRAKIELNYIEKDNTIAQKAIKTGKLLDILSAVFKVAATLVLFCNSCVPFYIYFSI